MSEKAEAIAALNDKFRRTFAGGRVILNRGVAALPEPSGLRVLEAVRAFAAFDEGDDPYGEHDFGAFDCDGQKFFWRIDYYNADLTTGAENPADPATTTRVLTVMLAEEY